MRRKNLIKTFFLETPLTSAISLLGIFSVITIVFLEIASFTQPSEQTQKIMWPQFDGNGARTGVNAAEFLINASDVSGLKLLWQKALPYTTNGTPVEVPNVSTANGTKDILFVTTQKGSLVAIDAATGTKIWQADTNGNFVGSQGTSSSPAVDPSGQFVYSYGLDGKVHKYAVATGTEDTTKGFPVTVTLSTDVEKISAPINIGNGYLYVVTSGYDGDFGAYVGHIVATNLNTGTTTVFNSLCSDVKQLSQAGFCSEKGSGIWGRAGAVVDPSTENVFIVTGNGNYNASSGGNNYGDSVIELKPDLSSIIDTYTPTSFNSLDSQDDDLGSTGIGILPQQSNTATPNLIVVGGKDNKVRLLNKDNLSGAGGPNHTGGELQTVGTDCQTLAHPVSWNDATGTTWVFFTDTCANLYAYKVVNSNNASTLTQVYQKNNIGKNSSFIANGILFVPDNNNISALDPTTGNVLWSSSQASAGGNIGSLHWQSPLVVNGNVVMPDNDGNLTEYALANITPQPTTGGGSGTTTIALTICPHGLGNCGDNAGSSGGNTNPIHTTRTVTVTILNSNNQPTTTATGTVTYDATNKIYSGTIPVPAVPTGQYLIKIALHGFLPKQATGILTLPSTTTISIPSLSVVTGDITNDGQLDISDYNALISCYGTKQTTATCTNPPTTQSAGSDINDDGNVNGADYNLMLREFSVQSGSM